MAYEVTAGYLAFPVNTRDPSAIDGIALRDAFRIQFNMAAATEAEVSKVIGTKTVKSWYAVWKHVRSGVKALPDQFRIAGMSDQQWASVQSVEAARGVIRARYAGERNVEAAAYHIKMVALDAAEAAALAANTSAMSKAVEVGYNNLPLRILVWVEGTPDKDDRGYAMSYALACARTCAVSIANGTVKGFKDPPPYANIPSRVVGVAFASSWQPTALDVAAGIANSPGPNVHDLNL